MPDQPQITPEKVKEVAKLARLAIPDQNLEKLAGELEFILGYINKINEVDMTGVEPMAHALPITNALRDDIIQPSLPVEKVLENAPERDGDFFKVPKVIGGEEDSAG